MGPQVRVAQVSRCRGLQPNHWLVGWSIQNLSREPIRILAANLPHGKFRSLERESVMALEILPYDSAQVELSVTCRELPGEIVENAFLILRVLFSEETWRILARLRVTFDDQGQPQTITELVTAHRIGFSDRQRQTF